jgi:histidinol-phosphate/aromatic aminotransferase/cobyric acid decarboxylase-like protein
VAAVTAPPAGEHGGDGARLAAALGVDPGGVLDLSASLNPVAPDAGAVVGKHLDALGRYPDAAAATAALARALAVDRDRVLLTNGGAEAIALVTSALGGRVEEPDFSLYPRGLDGPRWRSNPHNPTGRLAGEGETADVWDEAFWPLATGTWTRGDADRGAVVLGSLTKVLACPGLRAGYVVGDRALIDDLRDRQPAWSVNGLAAAALADLLATVDLPAWAAEVARLRRALVSVLREHGLEPEPSDANYVLVGRATGLRDRLARRGVLVRDCASFGLADHVRIAVPDDRGLTRLRDALVTA